MREKEFKLPISFKGKGGGESVEKEFKLRDWSLFISSYNWPSIKHHCTGNKLWFNQLRDPKEFPRDYICGSCGDNIPEQLVLVFKISKGYSGE